MNLDARLRKLESIEADTCSFVVVWTGIFDSSLPQNCVYYGREYEMVTSTTEEAVQRLAGRLISNSRPMLFLLNKKKPDASI